MSHQEIEHRFLVTAMDRSVLVGPGKEIVQGYLESPPRMSLRVRITDDREAHLARKEGSGLVREEEEIYTDLETARFLLGTCTDIVVKRRWFVQHDMQEWSVDVFAPPLGSVIIVEAELDRQDAPLTLPPWILDATEVTDSVNSQLLAQLATDLHGLDDGRLLTDLLTHRVPRIVLTGGPCSGKSSLFTLLSAEFGDVLHRVPGTVSYFIEHVGTKPPVSDAVGMRRYNRHLSITQRHIEHAAELQAARDGKRALLLDRAVCDSPAYLVGGFPALERILGTSRTHEFRQYDLVICLETASRDVYDAKLASHPTRYESYAVAVEVSRRTREVWSGHPNLIVVPSDIGWDAKVDAAFGAVRKFLG